MNRVARQRTAARRPAPQESAIDTRNQRDFYEVLGIPRDASTARIKDVFRSLAPEYHPDRNKAPDAQE